MINITIARRPLQAGTVAENMIKYESGGMDINGTRIAAPGETVTNHNRKDTDGNKQVFEHWSAPQATHQTEGQALGRWPANVILSHKAGCVQSDRKITESKEEEGFKPEPKNNPNKTIGHIALKHGYGVLSEYYEWDCVAGCGIKEISGQAGTYIGRFFKTTSGI